MDDDGSEKDRRSLSGGINSNPAQAALLSDLGAQHLEKVQPMTKFGPTITLIL